MADKKKLRRLQLTEVSLVAEGANAGADILFYKSKDGVPTPTNEESNVPFDINSIPENLRKSVQDELDRLVGEVELAKKAPPVKETAPVESTPADPEIPEAIQKHLNRQSETIQALQKALADKEESEFIAIAKSELANVPEVEVIAKGLYKLSKADKDLADQMRRALVSAQAIAKNAAKVMTTQSGKDGPNVSDGADTPLAKAEKMAKALQEKEPSLSFAKALTRVYEQNPNLYDEYDAASR